VLDERDAQRAHGGVLLDRVAVRHDDGAGHAVAARGPAHALAVVAARGADDFAGQRAALRELVKVGQAAADLERAHGRVVLVLDPAVGAQALAQQAQRYCGVAAKSRYTTWAAASMSARVGSPTSGGFRSRWECRPW
jgi:hypothetical protein